MTYDIFEHVTSYSDNRTYLHIKTQNTAHIDIRLYDILGKEVATLKNEMLFSGSHVIDVKQATKSRLEQGQYVYKISIGKRNFSKPIMVM